MEKNKMKYISKITEEILKEDEKARIDDFILYSKIIRKTNPEIRELNIHICLEHAKDFNLPPFSSVTRCRRKIFEKHPELCPDNIRKIRNKESIEYREWSKTNE